MRSVILNRGPGCYEDLPEILLNILSVVFFINFSLLWVFHIINFRQAGAHQFFCSKWCNEPVKVLKHCLSWYEFWQLKHNKLFWVRKKEQRVKIFLFWAKVHLKIERIGKKFRKYFWKQKFTINKSMNWIFFTEIGTGGSAQNKTGIALFQIYISKYDASSGIAEKIFISSRHVKFKNLHWVLKPKKLKAGQGLDI